MLLLLNMRALGRNDSHAGAYFTEEETDSKTSAPIRPSTLYPKF